MIRSATRQKNIAPLAFVVDLNSLDRTTGKQVDWDLMTSRYKRGAFVVTVNNQAAATDEYMNVSALQGDIPKGFVLQFPGPKFATLKQAAKKGDTQVFTEPLPATVPAAAKAYAGYEAGGGYYIPAGTAMCELSSGKVIPRAIRPAAETCVGILETDARSDAASDGITGYSVLMGGVLWENMLPDAVSGVFPSDYITELRARGGRWVFRTSRDSRGN